MDKWWDALSAEAAEKITELREERDHARREREYYKAELARAAALDVAEALQLTLDCWDTEGTMSNAVVDGLRASLAKLTAAERSAS